MLKFFKYIHNPEIRKVVECSSDGFEIGSPLALIGPVKELLKENIIFPDNTQGNEDKWLVVRNNEDWTIYEFPSLYEAKEYCKDHYTEW